MQRDFTIVGIHLLDLCRDHITLPEIVSHIQLVLFINATLNAAGFIYGTEVEVAVLVTIHVNHPPFLINLYNASHNDIANIGSITLSQRANAYNSIDLMYHTGHASIDQHLFGCSFWSAFVGAVTRDQSLANVVTWEYNLLHGNFSLMLRLVNLEVFSILK